MNVEIMQWDLRLLRPRLSVDLIKGLQMSRAKPKLTQIYSVCEADAAKP
jgi:hypothetical protein